MPALLTLLLTLWAATPAADSSAVRPVVSSAIEADEILWLARCIYSESDRPDEQRLVAWVVRNRVETGFRGATYRDVVLEDRQFSAFNEPTPRRERILALTGTDGPAAWQKALEIARDVYHARASERPFPVTTRHFYSPVSMRNRSVPDWAVNRASLPLASLGVDPNRFQFFDGIDQDGYESAVAADQIRARHDAVVGQMRHSRRTLRLSGKVPRPVPPTMPSRRAR